LGLPGDLRIETDEPELREDVRRVVEALHRASRLEAGWDTYNARPVATAVFRPALDLAIHAVQRCSSPTITAVSDGGITLVWDRATQELELEVSPNGEISAFMIDQHGEEIEPGEAIGLDDAKGLIDSFCRS
jgi:hypothetical protein